ncbi:sorting nexin-16-like [Anableps anableps]
MADPFVPVHFAINWFQVNKSCFKQGPSLLTNSSSTNSEASIPGCRPLGRVYGAAAGPSAIDETCTRPRGELMHRSAKLLGDSGNTEESWEENSITTTLLGYEILKEREKFTIYKILVKRPEGGSWLIFRRYTDFCILSDKLKELFPSFHQALPPKRRFKDNYDGRFLEKRQLGLQAFLEDLMLHNDIITSEPVRHFLSVDDPLNPFYSTDESRAFCETLEQKNHRLLRQLLEKQREVDSLMKSLEDKESYINLLWKKGGVLKSSDLEFQQHEKKGTNVNGQKQEQNLGILRMTKEGRKELNQGPNWN